MTTNFSYELLRKVLDSLDNYFPDNWEHRRAAKAPDQDPERVVEDQRLNALGYVNYNKIKSRALKLMKSMTPHLRDFEATYDMLSDEASRQVMVEQFAYRLIGHEHVILPHPTDDFAEKIAQLEAIAQPLPGMAVKTKGKDQALSRFDLREFGLPIQVMARPLGVYAIFLAEQYTYDVQGHRVAIETGDVVLDLGASYGDSALIFAHLAGPDGKIHAFEFLPSSLALMEQNFAMNPALAELISIQRAASWDVSDQKMYFADRGPATQVQLNPDSDCRDEALTLSIDDLVVRDGLRVDFIKMDIEGAEIPALTGAQRTIRTHRPKLAISAYHKLNDLALIPKLMAPLCPDYNFYLRSSTNFGAELVFFGAPKDG